MSDASSTTLPIVSVIMPIFNQAWSLDRTLSSLEWQTFSDWQLIVIDDGSSDGAEQQIRDRPTSRWPTIFVRSLENRGIGWALNTAMQHAAGRYVAYLPSDDVFFPNHLSDLVAVLDNDSSVFLAYGGVQTHSRWSGWAGMTLENAPGHLNKRATLVQLMHRNLARPYHWPERDELVTDQLEELFLDWIRLQDLSTASTAQISCEWTDHPDQHHKIVGETHDRRLPALRGNGSGRGLAAYRSFYGVAAGMSLDWQPSRGLRFNEHKQYSGLSVSSVDRPDTAQAGIRPLRILVVGELGFNPERFISMVHAGARLYGLWIPATETWDSTGSTGAGFEENIAYGPGWKERVRELDVDIIYGLLNYHAVPLIAEVAAARLAPLFFHFKESPFHCLSHGLWPLLRDVLRAAAGLVFISREAYAWFAFYAAPELVGKPVLILDGDLPPANRFRRDAVEVRSERPDGVHTVLVGRPSGLPAPEQLADHGVHLHIYGDHIREWYSGIFGSPQDNPFLHIHPTVYAWQWANELAGYDAGWLHAFPSNNGGDVRCATWSDLNVPARAATYAAAALPWIVRDQGPSVTSINSIVERHHLGIAFSDVADLAAQLQDANRLAEVRAGALASQQLFAFDTHVGHLLDFFSGKPSGELYDWSHRDAGC